MTSLREYSLEIVFGLNHLRTDLQVNTCVNVNGFRTGFEEEQVEALLHKIEIQIKHQSTSFGLALASVSTHICEDLGK